MDEKYHFSASEDGTFKSPTELNAKLRSNCEEDSPSGKMLQESRVKTDPIICILLSGFQRRDESSQVLLNFGSITRSVNRILLL